MTERRGNPLDRSAAAGRTGQAGLGSPPRGRLLGQVGLMAVAILGIQAVALVLAWASGGGW